MKKIKIGGKNSDKYLLVSAGDFSLISRYYWSLHSKGYAQAADTSRHKVVKAHTLIMRPSFGMQVDHINHNKLDNRRENLRIVTPSQNQYNRIKTKKKTFSKFKGVCLRKASGKWYSRIKYNNKIVNLGTFKIEEDAAKAYDKKAKQLFGEFAKLNFN